MHHLAMGCITVKGYRVGQSLNVSGYKAQPSVVVSGFNIHSPIQASAYAICPLTTAPYISITPQVLWLTEANNFMGRIEVDSNTNWRIEIKE